MLCEIITDKKRDVWAMADANTSLAMHSHGKGHTADF